MRKISVIVPVYNGTEVFQKLIESLCCTYPQPEPGLQFLFLDDASTDPKIFEFYRHSFFQRSDVQLHLQKQNGGFVRTVNRGVQLSPQDADLVLLNSDTQVWTRSFSKLQEISLRHTSVASVTPLTNQGTIASLFCWPYGLDTQAYFSPQEIAEQVEQAAIETPFVPAPTGVGFCMFISRPAWDGVGELAEAFGQGYGEECDWSQRAVRMGWHHLICTETYVHHSGTASFTSEQKKQQIARNSQRVEQRNPGYHAAVVRYVESRPLRVECFFLLVQLIAQNAKKRNSEARFFVYALHADSENPEGGGVEKHVKRSVDSLSAIHPVLVIFPSRPSRRDIFRVRIHFLNFIFLDDTFHAMTLSSMFLGIFHWIDILHFHHELGWPSVLIDRLLALPIPQKIFTVHDFYPLCPSVNLLKNRKKFCAVESDLLSCNECLKNDYEQSNLRIETYREKTRVRWKKFDLILFPSASLQAYFEKGLAQKGTLPWIKAQVFPHNLRYILPYIQPFSQPKRTAHTVVFLGHLVLHKGSEVLVEGLEGLLQAGFQLEIWGSYGGSRKRKVLSQVRLFSFRSLEELQELFRKRQPAFVVLPSITAESFSYLFYEAILLGRVPLVVGPFGNPAEVVKTQKLGRAMAAADGKGLLEACVEVRKNDSFYLENTERFADQLQSHLSNHVESYLQVIGALQTRTRVNDTGLRQPGLSQIDQMAQEQSGWVIRISMGIHRLLRLLGSRFPRLQNLGLNLARKLWRFFRRSKMATTALKGKDPLSLKS